MKIWLIDDVVQNVAVEIRVEEGDPRRTGVGSGATRTDGYLICDPPKRKNRDSSEPNRPAKRNKMESAPISIYCSSAEQSVDSDDGSITEPESDNIHLANPVNPSERVSEVDSEKEDDDESTPSTQALKRVGAIGRAREVIERLDHAIAGEDSEESVAETDDGGYSPLHIPEHQPEDE